MLWKSANTSRIYLDSPYMFTHLEHEVGHERGNFVGGMIYDDYLDETWNWEDKLLGSVMYTVRMF